MQRNDGQAPKPNVNDETSKQASPRSFENYSHLSPEEKGEIFRDVRSMQDQGVIDNSFRLTPEEKERVFQSVRSLIEQGVVIPAED